MDEDDGGATVEFVPDWGEGGVAEVFGVVAGEKSYTVGVEDVEGVSEF